VTPLFCRLIFLVLGVPLFAVGTISEKKWSFRFLMEQFPDWCLLLAVTCLHICVFVLIQNNRLRLS
jgi:hypothetical protein